MFQAWVSIRTPAGNLFQAWVYTRIKLYPLHVEASEPKALEVSRRLEDFTVLGFFFGSVHFYWGSAKNKVFSYHTKSRDEDYWRKLVLTASEGVVASANSLLWFVRFTRSLPTLDPDDNRELVNVPLPHTVSSPHGRCFFKSVVFHESVIGHS